MPNFATRGRDRRPGARTADIISVDGSRTAERSAPLSTTPSQCRGCARSTNAFDYASPPTRPRQHPPASVSRFGRRRPRALSAIRTCCACSHRRSACRRPRPHRRVPMPPMICTPGCATRTHGASASSTSRPPRHSSRRLPSRPRPASRRRGRTRPSATILQDGRRGTFTAAARAVRRFTNHKARTPNTPHLTLKHDVVSPSLSLSRRVACAPSGCAYRLRSRGRHLSRRFRPYIMRLPRGGP